MLRLRMLVLIWRKKNFDESHLLLDIVEVHSSIAGNILGRYRLKSVIILLLSERSFYFFKR